MQGRDDAHAEPLVDVHQHALDDQEPQDAEDEPLLRHPTDEGGCDQQEREKSDDVGHVSMQLDIARADEHEHAGEEDLDHQGGEIRPGDDGKGTRAGECADHGNGDLLSQRVLIAPPWFTLQPGADIRRAAVGDAVALT